MKIILDTNVLVNGVRDEYSHTFRIIQKCIDGQLSPIMSSRILREYEQKANELITDDEYFDMLDDFYDSAEEVWTTSRIRASEDRQDNKFIEAAVDGGAEYIISSDADLLDVGEYNGVRMVSPAEFWNIYMENDEEEASEWTAMVKQMMGTE